MVYPKFNLRSKNENVPVPLYLILNYDGYRFKVPTKIKVHPKYWNESKQRVRNQVCPLDHQNINIELDNLEESLKRAYMFYYDQNKVPTPSVLKDRLNKELNPKKEVEKPKVKVYSFWDAFELFLEERKRSKVSSDIIKDYNNSLRKHLTNFSKDYKVKLSLDTFKDDVNCIGSKFEKYLSEEVDSRKGVKGLSINTVGKVIKNLKAFLNFCFAKGIITQFSIRHLITKTEVVDSVYLTSAEIQILYDCHMPSKELEQVRDLFIVGCDTGLRYSDFSRIRTHHVDNGKIRIEQKKTKGKVVIPMSKRVKLILEKYHYRIPNVNSITEFNKILREAVKLAEIKVECQVSTSRQRYEGVEFLPKYELVSSHTARRSFCTNMYLKDVRAELIMKVSGHKTQQAFMRYLKLDGETAANELSQFID